MMKEDEHQRRQKRDMIDCIVAKAFITLEGRIYRSTIQYYTGRHFIGQGSTQEAVKEHLRRQIWNYEKHGRRG